MTLVESREEALWGLRWMQDAVQNSGKTKPGFYPVIGLLGAAGKLGKKSFVNNAARWKTGALVKMFFTKEKTSFTHLKYKKSKQYDLSAVYLHNHLQQHAHNQISIFDSKSLSNLLTLHSFSRCFSPKWLTISAFKWELQLAVGNWRVL